MTLFGIEPATFRFVAQHLNHCATQSNAHEKYFRAKAPGAKIWPLTLDGRVGADKLV